MQRELSIASFRLTQTDIIRFWVTAALALSIAAITFLAMEQNTATIASQLFYFPILYATYFYPRWGIYTAGACAVAYEMIAYIHVFPDLFAMGYATGQAVLFVCVALAVAYFTDKVRTSEERYRGIFEHSQTGIVLFDQNTFSIRLANEQFRQMLGYSAQALVKTPFSHLFMTRDGQRRFFELFGSNEDITDFETRLATMDREPFWVNLSWSRINRNLVSCSVMDINTRKLAEQAAHDSSAQYRQVTESSPTGIVITQNDQIIYANPAFSAFSGYEKDDLLGRDLAVLVDPDDKPAFSEFAKQAQAGPLLTGRTEFSFLTRGGGIKPATLYSTPIVQGGQAAVLINIADISERERLKEQIDKDNERRRGVITTVAHELRTPLQPIMGYLTMLVQDPKGFGLTEDTKQILDRCLQSVDRERQIINQMLELSVLDAGKLALAYSVFSVRNMLKNILDAGGYAANADITVDVPPDLTFEADADKIYNVIDSMLSNAVNYSKPPRRVRITYRSSAKDTHHRLAIQDNGTGITEAQLDAIFEPFQLADSAKLDRKTGRIGLSLSIAKQYIQMHGGYISVESIVNIGSTFTIHIPKTRPKEVMTSGT